MTGKRRGAAATLLALAAAATAAATELPDLTFEKFTLPNGLQVILHEDHAVPVAAVNVWYHVGSRDEPPGRTGFAHLFEHVMFQGSAHHDTAFGAPLQRVGGRFNGSTNRDRSNYWVTVPADQVELALWLEADRMGWLPDALTQEKLDVQREVVKNEKRQEENRPYAVVDTALAGLLFPADHPYRHPVIGSMADLDAATPADVVDFFRRHYVPDNASLCVAGDIDPAAVREMVTRLFGSIAPGAPRGRDTRWIPQLDGERRAVVQDAVPLPRLVVAWPTPGRYQPGDAEFDLLADILAAGKTSRLHRALVRERGLAQEVEVRQESRELGGTFVIEATAARGRDLAELESALDSELARLRDKGVQKDELAGARRRLVADLVRALQRVGGFGGRADRLNRYNVLTGDPGYLDRDLDRYRHATARDLAYQVRAWLHRDRRAVLHVVPRDTLRALPEAADRTRLPGSGTPAAFTPPAVRADTLANGLALVLVTRHDLPLVEARLVVRAGWTADPPDRPGTAALTADLLDEGADGEDALALAARSERLGADLRTRSFFDGAVVAASTLTDGLGDALALMADVALRPDFPPAELERARARYGGRQRRDAATPRTVAVLELQRRLFGSGHPYAQPFTGTGSPEALARLTVDDLRAFHAARYRPNNAALLLVGDVDPAEARARAERVFGAWESAPVPAPAVPAPGPHEGPRLLLVDRPGATQSMIVGGCVSIPRRDPDYEALQTLNTCLGGGFNSRINLNLRQERAVTYGARSRLSAFREAGVHLVWASVEADSTALALGELLREVADLGGARPVGAAELDDARDGRMRGFPLRFETRESIASQLETLVLDDLDLDAWQDVVPALRTLTPADLRRCAAAHLDPRAMVWVVVGDRATVAPGLADLGLGAPEVVVPAGP